MIGLLGRRASGFGLLELGAVTDTIGGIVYVIGGAGGRITRVASPPMIGLAGGVVYVRSGNTGAIFGGLNRERLITVYIAGVDRTEQVSIGVTRTMQIGGGSKANCSFKLWQKPVAYRPTQGDEVIIWMQRGTNPYDGSATPYRWFAGLVDNTSEYDYTGSAALSEITVNCADYGALCDRIIVGREYQSFEGNLASILFNQVCTQFLQDTLGIHYVFTWEPEIALGDQVYNWLTATAVFNSIAQACGGDWRVDFYRELLLFPANTGYLDAPFAIEDNDGNWIDMTVAHDSSKYRNRIGARNSANTRPLWTDTFTGDGLTRIWHTMSPLNSQPIIRVNGVAAVVVPFSEIGLHPYDFNWSAGSGGDVVQNLTHAALTSSDTLTITYPSPLSYVAWAQDDAEIAAYGLFEGIEEVKDVATTDALQAIADQLLARRKIRPITATFQTDKDGLEPGMMVNVNTSRPLLDAPMLVTSVTSTEQGKSFFRHQVRAVNSANQAVSDNAAFYQQLIARSSQPKDRVRQNVVFHVAETIEGLSNPGLTAGTKISASRTCPCDGYLSQATLYFNSSQTVATTSEIIIDVLLDGTSIFGATKMVWPAGATATQVQNEFIAEPFPVLRGDLFELVVISADPLATDGILEIELLVK